MSSRYPMASDRSRRANAMVLSTVLALAVSVAPVSVRPAAAVSGIDIELPAGHTISGTVTGPGSVPLAGAAVDASGDTSTSLGATTAADGSYVIHGLADGTYQVRFAGASGVDLLPRWYGAQTGDPDGAVDVVLAGADVGGIDATLEAGATISGTVTGDGIHPVTGIRVSASSATGGGSVLLGADGSFTIVGLFPDQYRLSILTRADDPYRAGPVVDGAVVQAPAHPSLVDISGGNATSVDVQLEVGFTISGHVSGGDGPVAVDASDDVGGYAYGYTVSTVGGDYVVRGLWPATYVVRFTQPGDELNPDVSGFPYGAYAEGALVDQNAGVAVDATAGNITLASVAIPPGVALRGTITGGGAPLDHAYVYVCNQAGSLGCVSTFTGADGTYAIGYFETGDWVVLAAAGHHVAGYYGPGGYVAGPGDATPVFVDADGSDVTGIDIDLPSGGTIVGHVTGPGALPASGMSLSTSGRRYPGAALCLSAADGSYACDGLTAGLQPLFVHPPNGSDLLPGYYAAGAPGHFTIDHQQATLISVTDGSDTVAPTILTRSPASGAVKVARDVVVAVTFSEGVSGISSSTFQLRAVTTGKLVPAGLGYNSTTHVARLDPTALLAVGTRYRVILTAGLADAAGNHLLATSWTFTTTTDATRPHVSSRSPASGAVNVLSSAKVRVTFSERVKGVTTSSLRLVDRSTGKAVPGTVSYDPTTRTARFSPSAPLRHHRVYVVVLTTGIRDLVGNPVVVATWRFTTGSH